MSAETRDPLVPFLELVNHWRKESREARSESVRCVYRDGADDLLEAVVRARQRLSAPPRASEGKEGAGND